MVQGLGRQPGRRCPSLRRISRVSEPPRRDARPVPGLDLCHRLTHSELVDLPGASHRGGVDSEPRLIVLVEFAVIRRLPLLTVSKGSARSGPSGADLANHTGPDGTGAFSSVPRLIRKAGWRA